MKKIKITALLVCIALMLCACGNEQFLEGDSHNDRASMQREAKTPTYDTIHKYRGLLLLHKVSDHFVYYRQVKHLGRFDSIVFFSSSNYRSYMYSFCGPSCGLFNHDYDNEIVLYVYEKEMQEEFTFYEPLAATAVNLEDMRDLNEEISKTSNFITDDGLMYTYIKSGVLVSIKWVDEQGTHFSLSSIHNGPLSPFVERLMDASTAAQAIREISTIASTSPYPLVDAAS